MYKRAPLSSVRDTKNGVKVNTFRINVEEGSLSWLTRQCYVLLRFFNSRLPLTIVGYLCSVILVSLNFGYVLEAPKTYFSKKTNILNVYFVKFGWGWTFAVVGFMMFLISFLKHRKDLKCIAVDMSHLLFGTFWWWVCVQLIEHVSATFGFCSGVFSWYPKDCQTNFWSSLDISGHSFLLLYNILIILEESKAFLECCSIPKKLDNTKSKKEDSSEEGESSVLNTAESYTTKLVLISVVAVTVLFVIWNVMLLATLVYFHDTVQKFLGALLAVIGWFLSYRIIFKLYDPCINKSH